MKMLAVGPNTGWRLISTHQVDVLRIYASWLLNLHARVIFFGSCKSTRMVLMSHSPVTTTRHTRLLTRHSVEMFFIQSVNPRSGLLCKGRRSSEFHVLRMSRSLDGCSFDLLGMCAVSLSLTRLWSLVLALSPSFEPRVACHSSALWPSLI